MSNKYFLGSAANLQSTSSSTLATGVQHTGDTPYDNSSGLFFWGDILLVSAFATAPVSGSVDLYLIPAPDGTNYADSPTSPLPANLYVGSWLANFTTSQRLHLRGVSLPPFLFRAYVNNNTGQTMSANWNIILYPYAEQ